MRDLMTHNLRTWIVRLVVIVLVGLVLGMGLRLYSRDNNVDEKLVFVVGEHCASETANFLSELEEAGFATTFRKVNFSNGEFPNIAYVATIGYHNFKLEQLEEFARGAMANCWANSSSRYDMSELDSTYRAVEYIQMLNSRRGSLVLISADKNILTIKTR